MLHWNPSPRLAIDMPAIRKGHLHQCKEGCRSPFDLTVSVCIEVEEAVKMVHPMHIHPIELHSRRDSWLLFINRWRRSVCQELALRGALVGQTKYTRFFMHCPAPRVLLQISPCRSTPP